ncbi:MAG: hypothetical protein LBF36_02910 [Mycoplasmataceae bacterium]|nr:hypothetical protein [Mycoplasmataceae bacterium]
MYTRVSEWLFLWVDTPPIVLLILKYLRINKKWKKLLKFATPILVLSSITFPISFVSACSKTPTFPVSFTTLQYIDMGSDLAIVFGDVLRGFSIGVYKLVTTTTDDNSPTGMFSMYNILVDRKMYYLLVSQWERKEKCQHECILKECQHMIQCPLLVEPQRMK